MSSTEIMKNIMLMLKITTICFSVKTRSYLLKNTQKSSLHQFSNKLTHAELVKTRALFAGNVYLSISNVIALGFL